MSLRKQNLEFDLVKGGGFQVGGGGKKYCWETGEGGKHDGKQVMSSVLTFCHGGEGRRQVSKWKKGYLKWRSASLENYLV